jgi:phospholipid transport system transporter-binding protein
MIERDGNQLRVSGALTIANAAAECEAAKQHFSGEVVVDLAAVTEVDSSALSLLFEWRRAAQRNNCHISFRNLPESLKSLAALYGVADLVAADA